MWVTPQGREGLFSTWKLFVVLVSFLSRLEPLSAVHPLVGVPPVIASNQGDVVVSSDFLVAGANLVLQCNTTGDPAPTIAWFMDEGQVPEEFVMSDGRLVRNVTDGDGASQTGTTYYCTAMNLIGDSLPATARSKDINVTYTFFNGFRNRDIRTEQLRTVVDGAVAMECDFLDASPRPQVQWVMNNVTTIDMDDDILVLEGGRFLYIRSLTSQQRSSFFHCEVINAFLGTMPQRSPTTYTLDGDIPPGILETYIGDRSVTAMLGEPVKVVLVAAADGTMDLTAQVLLTCTQAVENSPAMVTISNDVMATFTELPDVEGNRQLNFTCDIPVLRSLVPDSTVTYSFNIVDPASITAPAVDAESLIDRERLVGEGPVMFTCGNRGIPTPMVRWYHNGEPIQPDSGVSVNGNQVVISEPQVSNSGVYQCVVSNTIDGVVMENMRQWVLEVREPAAPVVSALTTTNPTAEPDRREGTVIVADPGTLNVAVAVNVTSDPCPTVQWSINGTDISDDSPDYFINNPCGGGSSSPYTFTITIANLTSATSGQYSAVFSHLADSTTLPGLYVTVPVMVKVQNLFLTVEDTGFQCLFEGRNVVLTCEIFGFPRPEIVFKRDDINIIPGIAGFERITDISLDQIQIADVDETDEALYTCETTLPGNAMPAVLVPQFCTQPRIVETMVVPSEQNTSVIGVGGPLMFICDPEGIPEPVVQWAKDDDVITPGSGITIVTIAGTGASRLTLESVTLENNADYTCTITNPAGTAQFTFQEDRIREINEPSTDAGPRMSPASPRMSPATPRMSPASPRMSPATPRMSPASPRMSPASGVSTDLDVYILSIIMTILI